jgi:hypothetical protein
MIPVLKNSLRSDTRTHPMQTHMNHTCISKEVAPGDMPKAPLLEQHGNLILILHRELVDREVRIATRGDMFISAARQNIPVSTYIT